MKTDTPLINTTLSHYQENGDQFFDNTIDVDMTVLYDRFLPFVPVGGHILDAGCGSGRDALAFLNAGYRVTAFDASPAMSEKAARLIGQPVEVTTFQQFHSNGLFDGVWACASLLHVPLEELHLAIKNLAACTRVGGAIYMSFKLGSGERFSKGRRFTDLDRNGLAGLLRLLPNLGLKEAWTTNDLRPGRENEDWFNAVLVKHE